METTDSHLPEEDVDARLARAVGDALDRNEFDAFLTHSDDPFVSAVTAYSMHQDVGGVSAEGSTALWREINKRTTSDTRASQPRMRLLARPFSSHRWAVAASLGILALVTISALLLFRSNTAELVAQAGNASTSVILSDGSEVVLRRHSTLYKLAEQRTKVVYRLEGEATFSVTHDPSRSFVLEAGNGEISVLGTKFVVSTWANETRVFLSEGSIRFANLAESEEVVLKPGQESILRKGNTLTKPTAADEKEFLDWTVEQMLFEQRTVESVIGEFGHHFGVALSVPDSLLSETITGSIELSSIEQSLNTLGIVLGGEFGRVDSAHYVLTKSR